MPFREIKSYMDYAYNSATGSDKNVAKTHPTLLEPRTVFINVDLVSSVEELSHGFVLVCLNNGQYTERHYLRLPIKDALELLAS